MKRGIRFKVWQGHSPYGERFFFHMIAGNNEVVSPSEGYPDARTAFKSVTSIWKGLAKALFPDPPLDWKLPPVPYTKDSLKPKA